MRLRGLLPVEADEINRIDIKRRETTVAYRVGDHLPGEREQKPRALDHDHRVELVLRDVADPEDARIGEVEGEQHLVADLGIAFELQIDLEIGVAHLLGVDVHLDADLRLLLNSGPAEGERYVAAGVPWFSCLFGRDALITSMQLLCLRLSQLAAAGKMTEGMASLAKMNNAAKARKVVADARDILGGNGILLENHVARHHADMEAVYTYEGTDAIQSLIVGREITGESAFTSR